jgi:hypothetical protein
MVLVNNETEPINTFLMNFKQLLYRLLLSVNYNTVLINCQLLCFSAVAYALDLSEQTS